MKPTPFTYFRPDAVDAALHLHPLWRRRESPRWRPEPATPDGLPPSHPCFPHRHHPPDRTRRCCRGDGRMIVGTLVPSDPRAQSVGALGMYSAGTVGGSLVHADPAAELTGVWVAADGSVTLASPRGHRGVAAEDCSTTGVPGAATSISTELGTTSAQRPGGHQGPGRGRHGLVRYGLTRMERPAYLSRSSAPVSGPYRAGQTLFVYRDSIPAKDTALCRERGCRGQQRGSSVR